MRSALVALCAAATLLASCRRKSPDEQLEDAVAAGDEAAVTAAVKAGAKIDEPAPTHGGGSAICAALHTRGPDDPPTGLALGAKSQHFIVHLLSLGADPNQACDPTTGTKVVHEAASRDLVTVLKALQDKKADLNAATTNGETPLYRAACVGAVDAARLLHAAGASPLGAKNPDGSRSDAATCARFKLSGTLDPKQRAPFEEILKIVGSK